MSSWDDGCPSVGAAAQLSSTLTLEPDWRMLFLWLSYVLTGCGYSHTTTLPFLRVGFLKKPFYFDITLGLQKCKGSTLSPHISSTELPHVCILRDHSAFTETKTFTLGKHF